MLKNWVFRQMPLFMIVSVALLAIGCGSSSSSAPPDTAPPSQPGTLTAVAASSTKVSLRWLPSTDDVGVTGYKIYRGSPLVQIGTATDSVYSDLTCTASTAYVYQVTAYDAAGKESALSTSATATTLAAETGDITAPSPPGTLTATAASSSKISLSWGTSTDAVGVSGYNIYRAGASCDNPSKIGTTTTTTYADTGLAANTTYCYVVKAFDGVGITHESPASNQAPATTLP